MLAERSLVRRAGGAQYNCEIEARWGRDPNRNRHEHLEGGGAETESARD
jgi:hypothetical protein